MTVQRRMNRKEKVAMKGKGGRRKLESHRVAEGDENSITIINRWHTVTPIIGISLSYN